MDGAEFVFAVFSPDGRYIATNDITTNAIWIADINGDETRAIGRISDQLSTTRSAQLVHWGPDGLLWIVAREDRILSTVPASGGPVTTVGALPQECMGEGFFSMNAAAGLITCSVNERASDVWVIDDFDPDVAAAESR